MRSERLSRLHCCELLLLKGFFRTDTRVAASGHAESTHRIARYATSYGTKKLMHGNSNLTPEIAAN